MNDEIRRRPVLLHQFPKQSIDDKALDVLEKEARQINIANTFAINRFISLVEDKGLDNILAGNKPAEPLIDTNEMAEHLGLRPLAVRKMAQRGDIPYIKIPPKSIRGKLLFKISEVEKALTENISKRGRPPKRHI